MSFYYLRKKCKISSSALKVYFFFLLVLKEIKRFSRLQKISCVASQVPRKCEFDPLGQEDPLDPLENPMDNVA